MSRRPPIGRSVGSLVPQVAKKAMEAYGFPAAAVLTDWPQIAGPELAAYTAPERLRWPRHSDDDEEPGSEGATLVYAMDQQFNLLDPNEGRLPPESFGSDLWHEDNN